MILSNHFNLHLTGNNHHLDNILHRHTVDRIETVPHKHKTQNSHIDSSHENIDNLHTCSRNSLIVNHLNSNHFILEYKLCHLPIRLLYGTRIGI